MGFVKPHTRAQLFDGAVKTSPSSYNRPVVSRPDVTNLPWARQEREKSPLLQSFKDEAERLEREVQSAKHRELQHKTRSMQEMIGSSVTSDQPANDPKRVTGHFNFEVKTKTKPIYVNVQSPVTRSGIETFATSPIPRFSVLNNATTADVSVVRNPPINSLPVSGYTTFTTTQNNDAMKTQLMTSPLEEAAEMTRRMEQLAAERGRQQRQIIEELVQGIPTVRLQFKLFGGKRQEGGLFLHPIVVCMDTT